MTEKVEIGEATLYCGDCLEILPTLEEVDAVVTDPPYNEVNRATGGLRHLYKGGADSAPVSPSGLAEHFIRLASIVYVWCGTEQVSEYRRSFVGAGLSTRQCVWEKPNASPMNGEKMWLSSVELCVYARKPKATHNAHCKSPVWRFPVERSDYDHPTKKPVPLMAEQVSASTHFGDVVLDPFMGSGTTGVACANLGRKFIGIEIERKYFDIACERIEAAYAQGRLFA
jgi:site-specific DNA-methyltransferase (adenine-specific)